MKTTLQRYRIAFRTVSACVALLVIWLPWNMGLLQAQEDRPASLRRDEVDDAIDRALRFIVSNQKDDGSIADRQHETTMTALSIMALASTGVTPSVPDELGDCSRRALAYVLEDERMEANGYFGNKDGSRMYGHGIITLMLTEMLGMGIDAEQDRLIEERCQRAINLILSAQQEKKPRMYVGGWRYTPNSNDSDLSVSVWQLMALRSAKNDGLEVPAEAIQQALEYLQRSYTSRMDANGQPFEAVAGFGYLPESGGATFTMTAAGLLAMQVCGQYESPLVEGAAEWLEQHPPEWSERFIFYGLYYFSQGMHQRGGEQAERAEALVRDMLLARQRSDGSWEADGGEEGGAGKLYCTCMAVLSLSVKYHYLPIYQR